MAVATQAGIMKDNKLRAGRALFADSLATIVGAILVQQQLHLILNLLLV